MENLTPLDIIQQIGKDEKDISVLSDARAKKLYTILFLNKIFPEVMETYPPKTMGYHGKDHSKQVGLFGLDYALSLKKDPLPVLLAAALHDCARENDNYDTTHAENCRPLATAFLKKYESFLTEEKNNQIIDAIVNHTRGTIAPDYVSACLWDADRTTLSWYRGFNPIFFNTERGKKVASLPFPDQMVYLTRQNQHLLKIADRKNLLLQKIKADSRSR